jgi:hypothetical protein
MTPPPWADDEALLADMKEAATATDVPDGYVTAALGALAWLSVDADIALAEVTFDSARDVELATRSGGDGSTRTLAFAGGGVTVDLEITAAGITGQLTPAVDGRVRCQTPTGTCDESGTDAVGCFVLGPPPDGPVRLLLSHGDQAVATTWIRLP